MLDIASNIDWKTAWCRCEICLSTISQEVEENSLPVSEPNDCTNLQKKIMPWTSMFLEDDFLSNNNENDGRVIKSSHEDLIVVASLIDKIPNLGGLCRSCEIFGVGTYVIGSKKYCDNKEFQTLSVTSDRYVQL
jgi:tRNA guanosine-2'-O-methyltransferase